MTTTRREYDHLWRAISAWAAMFLTATVATAEVNGTLTTTDGRQITGAIRWMPSSQAYTVTLPSGVAVKLTRVEIKGAPDVAKPAELDAAVSQAAAGQYDAAIPILEKVMADYTMLEWDATAARALAEAYLKKNEPAKALEMCEKIIQGDPTALQSGEIPRVYWDALLETKQYAKLIKVLGDVSGKGDRLLAAAAYTKRGDVEMKKGNLKDALVDGYLRTLTMFADVPASQPEALYKAVKCFEELGQASNAEKMRQKLYNDFSEDPYTAKLRAGV